MSNGSYILGFGKQHNQVFNDLYIYKSNLDHIVKYVINDLPATCSLSYCKDKRNIVIYGGCDGFVASLRCDS